MRHHSDSREGYAERVAAAERAARRRSEETARLAGLLGLAYRLTNDLADAHAYGTDGPDLADALHAARDAARLIGETLADALDADGAR